MIFIKFIQSKTNIWIQFSNQMRNSVCLFHYRPFQIGNTQMFLISKIVIIFDSIMQKINGLNSSFLSNHCEEAQEREPDMDRLKRKIFKQLPEHKINKTIVKSEGIFCKKVFNPNSTFILGWSILIIMLIYIYFIEIPITVAFEDPRTGNQQFLLSLNFPVMFIFIIDIGINLNTGFYQDGQLQTDPSKIKMNYLKDTLPFDVVSLGAIFCFELGYIIPQFDPLNQYLWFIYLLFFLRFKKVVKLQKAVQTSFDLNRRTKATFKLIMLFIKILFICNMVASGGFMLSKYLYENVKIMNSDQTQCGQDCYWVTSTSQADKNLLQCSFNIQYIYSLYWASTTMISIGYGDITPKNSYEVTFTVIIQFLSCLLYAYSINQIWNIIVELNRKKDRINSRLSTINLYMRDKQITPQLTSKIDGYLTHYYYNKNLRQRQTEKQIIGELTPSLKRQLYYESYSVLLRHKFFVSMTQKVILAASQNVKQVCCYEDEVLSPGDFSYSPCLYYLKKGQMKRQYGGKSKIQIRNIYKGETIGLYEFICQLSYLSSITAIQYTLAYYIQYCYWRTALLEDKGCFQYFYLTKQSLLLYNQFERIGQLCFFCSLQDHRTELCNYYKITKDIKKSSEFFRKSQDQHRKPQFARRKFTIKINEKKIRKKSFCKGNELYTPRRNNIHHNSLMLHIDNIDEYRSNRKWSITEQYQLRRGGKFFVKPRQKHQRLMLQTVRQLYANKQEIQSQSENVSQEIKLREIDIDVLAHYEEYYPKYNCSEMNPRQLNKRRMTRSFYF